MTAIGQENIARRAWELVEPILARDGFELVEVEWGREANGWVLRLFIDRPGGVTIDHCQEVSRTIDPVLDVEDFIDTRYHLEVSSPGLVRPLRRPADFQRFSGLRARLRAHRPVDTGAGPRRSWTGILRGYRDGMVEIEVDGLLHRVPHDQVAKAHLEHDFEAELQRRE